MSIWGLSAERAGGRYLFFIFSWLSQRKGGRGWEGGSIGSPLLRVAVKSHTNPGGEICHAGSRQKHNKIQTGTRAVYKCLRQLPQQGYTSCANSRLEGCLTVHLPHEIK